MHFRMISMATAVSLDKGKLSEAGRRQSVGDAEKRVISLT